MALFGLALDSDRGAANTASTVVLAVFPDWATEAIGLPFSTTHIAMTFALPVPGLASWTVFGVTRDVSPCREYSWLLALDPIPRLGARMRMATCRNVWRDLGNADDDPLRRPGHVESLGGMRLMVKV